MSDPVRRDPSKTLVSISQGGDTLIITDLETRRYAYRSLGQGQISEADGSRFCEVPAKDVTTLALEITQNAWRENPGNIFQQLARALHRGPADGIYQVPRGLLEYLCEPAPNMEHARPIETPVTVKQYDGKPIPRGGR